MEVDPRKWTDLEVRKDKGQHLIVVRPELEECFFRSMKRINLKSELSDRPEDLRRILGAPNREHPKHKAFRRELKDLYERAKSKRTPSFILDLEKIVRGQLSELQ